MKGLVFGVLAVAVMLAGCRRETPYYEPMKLGAHIEQPRDGGALR